MNKRRKILLWAIPIALLCLAGLLTAIVEGVATFQKAHPEKALTNLVQVFNARGDWIKGSPFAQGLLRDYVNSLRIREQPWPVSVFISEKRRPDYLIVAIGDSLTAGRRLDEQQRYTYFLEKLIGFHMPGKTVKVVNAGVPGDTIAGVYDRLDRDLIPLQPDLVILGLGFNDAGLLAVTNSGPASLVPLNQFEQTYNKVVSKIKAETSAKVLLFSPAPLASFYESPLGDAATAKQVAAFLPYAMLASQMAQKHDCAFADTYTELSENPIAGGAFLKDGVHPNPIGNLLMARPMFMAWLALEEVTPKAPFLALVPQAIGKIHLSQSNIKFHGTFDIPQPKGKWKKWMKTKKKNQANQNPGQQ
jgi:lysophospholipase L1-like esterase